MCKIDEHDDLDIDTIAAQLLDDDYYNEEGQINKYGDHGVTAARRYHNSGCGCLMFILGVLSTSIASMLLIWGYLV